MKCWLNQNNLSDPKNQTNHTINPIHKPNINNPFQTLKNQRIQRNTLVFLLENILIYYIITKQTTKHKQRAEFCIQKLLDHTAFGYPVHEPSLFYSKLCFFNVCFSLCFLVNQTGNERVWEINNCLNILGTIILFLIFLFNWA